MSTADGSRIVGAIRIVIVGGGRIGQVHAHNILMNGAGLRLTAIVEPFPTESLTSLAARADVPVASELGNWLAEADALIIALPTDMHEEVLIAAAAAGVHVLCEKPLAGDLDAARRMIAAAEKAGIVLQVGFNRRFDHNYRALRAAAANGGVGRIETVRVTSRDPGPPGIDYIRQSGGLFMDMTIHDFDMIRFLTGDEVESVFARGACLVDEAIGQAGDIDTALVTVRFKGGAIGVIENSRRASYGYDQRAEIHGSRGAAESRNDTESRVTISDASGVHDEKPLHFFLERYRESFVAEVQSFTAAVRDGSTPEVTGHDGLEAMRIAAACRRSLESGREVALSEIQ